MRTKSYVINHRPISWKAPGRNGNNYFDKQTLLKTTYGLYIIKHHEQEPLFQGPLAIDIIYYVPIPKSINKRNSSGFSSDAPDIDNMTALLFDSINKTNIVWHDDRQVAVVNKRKIYGKEPRIEFTISQLEDRS
jgi:crossover junction endodeoxyribonuclease RusA